ncbi:MAG: hypothetical protein CSB47_05135 [Proteobacteria bacterium]|nr:MAG: hypothetical protein CSB47_05135 [Pseudomonadota bacterium]
MIKRALLLLLLTAAWGFGSWWYYTCKLKGFCRTDGDVTAVTGKALATGTVTTAIATEATKTTPATDSKTTDFVDQDGDAISDEDERALGTDPENADSDGDGTKDNEELGIDLKSPIDTDNDGVINALDDDDDNDGIPSQLEIKLSSDPLSADTDGDGVSDGDELGDDKNDPADSDGDGIIDLLDAIDDGTKPSTKTDEEQASTDATDASQGQEEAQAPPEASEGTAPKTDESAPTNDTVEQNQAIEKPAANNEVTIDTDAAQQSGASDGEIPFQKSRLYFPFRSANPRLSPAATEYFKGVVTWLNQSKANRIVLTGHTDNVGKAKNNLDLGLKRAIEIKDLVVKLGADSAQVEVASMGESQPVASNKTDEGRRKNRRVELIPVIK